jgi:hypothetical protein
MVEQLCTILRDDVSEYLHKYVHFDINVTIALIYTDRNDAREVIARHIRESDKVIPVSTHLYAVIFQFTDTEKEADAAAQNLENRLLEKGRALAAYTHFHESDKDADTIVTRLYDIFEDLFTKQKGNIESDALYFKEFMANHITMENL